MSKKEVVVVTGASRGIGGAIAKELASSQRKIYVAYRSQKEAAKEVVKQCEEQNAEALAIELDVNNGQMVTSVFESIFKEERSIDVLVNNAAIVRDAPLLGMEERDWQDVIDTNLTGLFHVSKVVGKYMVMRRRGRIINVSSVVARYGGRGQANYVASKGGVEAFTRALAIELAPRNVLVNAVAPGVVETDMSKEVINEHREKILDRILLGRTGKAEEIAKVVAFLAGPSATYITGQVINVDGGMLLNF